MLQVAGWCRPDTAGALHGFGDDGCDLVAVVGKDLLHGFFVVGHDVDDPGNQRAPSFPVGGDALHRRAAIVGPVIAAFPADDDLLLRVACLSLSDAGELHGRVDGLGTGRAKKTRHSSYGDSSAILAANSSAGALVNGSNVWYAARLSPVRRSPRDLFTAVADVDVPERGHAIDVVIPLVVQDDGALAASMVMNSRLRGGVNGCRNDPGISAAFRFGSLIM